MFYYCHNRWNFKYILDVMKGVISKTSHNHIKGFFFQNLKLYQFFFHTHKSVNLKMYVCSRFNTRKLFFFLIHEVAFFVSNFIFSKFHHATSNRWCWSYRYEMFILYTTEDLCSSFPPTSLCLPYIFWIVSSLVQCTYM